MASVSSVVSDAGFLRSTIKLLNQAAAASYDHFLNDTDDMFANARRCKCHRAVDAANDGYDYLVKWAAPNPTLRLEYKFLINPNSNSSNSLPKSWSRFGIKRDSTLKERKELLGLPPGKLTPDPDIVEHLDPALKHGATARRISHWSWRIGAAMAENVAAGWWPIFDTLTVDPSRVSDPAAFMADGTEWSRYLRRWARLVARTLGIPRDYKTSDYFRYVAVLEHGASREHHHIHVLLWCKALPANFTADPNMGYHYACLLYTSPSPRDRTRSRMPSSA